MPRRPEGWKLRKRKGRPYSARWTIDGEQVEVGLGTFDAAEAGRLAQAAYADSVRGARRRVHRWRTNGEAPSTAEAGREWLANSAGTLKESTRELYRVHLSTLATAFPTLSEATTEPIEIYQRSRLAAVQSATVRKELATLRGLLRYAYSRGWIGVVPEVRVLPRAKGTRFAKRRRVAADDLSPVEVRQVLAALPKWSASRKVERFAVRARFVVAYETSLRPSFLDVLSVPEHYTRGAAHIRIPLEGDKAGQERRHPLTDKARKELDSIAPECGLIFGKHDYRLHIGRAAKKALPPDKAERFTGAHLRSARCTHWLERTSNVAGVQRLMGHTQIATTTRYLRASDRAAEAVIRGSKKR